MKKLLIVEDDKNWADIMGKFAMDVGAEYRVAVSGGQAIEIIDDWRPDALILDMLLAGGTDNIRYMVNAGVYDETGIMISSNFRRFSLLSNLDFNLSTKLSAFTRINLT